MSQSMDPTCIKIVFFLASDAQGCHVLKDYFNIISKDEVEDNDEELACNYFSYEINKNKTILKLKLYFVCDPEKFEQLRLLYFRNVDIGVLVSDVGKENVLPYEKIVEDLRSHNSNSSIIFLECRTNDDNIPASVRDFLSCVQGRYFEFSDTFGLDNIFELLYDHIFSLNNRIVPYTGSNTDP